MPHPNIRKTGPSHWEIPRKLVRHYTSSVARFNSLGASRPYKEGDQRGWLVSAFGCKSPLYKGGLRSRDVVQSVNGRPTYTWLQVFGLYARMGTIREFEVKVLRKGRVVTLHYTLT